MGVIEKIQAALREQDWSENGKSKDDLARILGVSKQSIQRLIWGAEADAGMERKQTRTIDQNEIRPLCRFFGIPYEMGTEVPIRGVVGAGAHLLPNSDIGDCGTVDLPFTDGQPLMALRVSGESMFPVYREGDYLICGTNLMTDGRGIDGIIGRECVVHTTDDLIAVKVPLDNAETGRWNLMSYNAPMIFDVDLQGVYEVLYVKRAPQVMGAIMSQ